ncbi:MAG: nicotinate-nucleotide--dimethylbenzimidazole phosphoribosyltransferase [Deltaproteobacteria bacterium]
MELGLRPYRGLGKLDILHRRLNDCNCHAKQYGLVLFAADHGISEHKLSNYEPLSSNRIIEQHISGMSPTARMLSRLGKREYILDVGLARPISDDVVGELEKVEFAGKYKGFSSKSAELLSYGIKSYSRDFIENDALSPDEIGLAMSAGRDYWYILSENNFDIMGIGEVGIGNTLCAAALAVAATGLDPRQLVGRGSSSNEVIARKIDIIIRALNYRTPRSDNIVDLLTRFGGLEIAAMVGFISKAAENRVPIMLDGYVTAVAGYLAAMTNERVPEILIAPSLADQIGHGLILERLGLDAMFDLSINYGEGLAATFGLFLAESTEIFYN